MFPAQRKQILALAVAVSLTACGGDKDPTGLDSNEAATVATVVVTPATNNLVSIGATVQLSAVARDASGNTIPGKSFTWSSSAIAVATVSISGIATAVANGTASITATTDGVQGTASLSVAPVTSTIEVTPAIGELNSIGATLQFSAVAKDGNGNVIAGKTFTWSTSATPIATVDAVTGIATAVASGTATITASADGVDGNASLTMNLTGTGSGTMLVIANVSANDIGGGLFNTDFSVTLTDAGAAPVGGATVTVTNLVLGAVVLTETGPGTGIYTAAASQFPGGDFQLDVVRGLDNVHDVVARGPGVHTISSPLANDTVTVGQDLPVTWTVPSQAKFAEIETRDFAQLQLLDDGSFVIPGANNPANANQRIRLFRFNEVDVAGGLAGSRLQIKIRAQVEPVVVE